MMEYFFDKIKADKIKIIILLIAILIIIAFLAFYYINFISEQQKNIGLSEENNINTAGNNMFLTPEQEKTLINLMTANPNATSSLTKKQINSSIKSMTASPSKSGLSDEEKNKLIDSMTAK